MTDVQLQQKLSNSNVATIWIYQSTNNNGVVLYILNYNGHELARKELILTRHLRTAFVS